MNPIKSTLLFSTLLAVSLSAQQYRGVSENFDLQIQKPLEEVQSMSRETGPMVERMTESFAKINTALDDVKSNPNNLTKAKFELAYANLIGDLVRDVDEVVVNKEQMQYAFQDIESEVKRVIHGMKNNRQRALDQGLAAKEKTDKQLAIVKEAAREMRKKAANGSMTDADKRSFKNLERNLKNAQRIQKAHDTTALMLGKYLNKLGKMGAEVKDGADSIESVFDSLNGLRDSFKSIAQSRSSIAKIKKSMRDGGVQKALESLKAIEKGLDQFNTISDKINKSMDQIDAIDPENPDSFKDGNADDTASWENY